MGSFLKSGNDWINIGNRFTSIFKKKLWNVRSQNKIENKNGLDKINFTTKKLDSFIKLCNLYRETMRKTAILSVENCQNDT